MLNQTSDVNNLPHELNHLHKVLTTNGYSRHEINDVISDKNDSKKTGEEQEKKLAFLPFCGSVSGKKSRLLKRHNIKSVFRPPVKIRQLLRPVEDAAGLRTPWTHRISCECGQSYVGQTVRTIEKRRKEHERCFRLRYPEKSVLAEHALENGQRIKFDDTAVVARTDVFWDCVINEAIDSTVAAQGGVEPGDREVEAGTPAIEPKH